MPVTYRREGRIGVITIVPNLEGLLEKLGIKAAVFTSGPVYHAATALTMGVATDEMLGKAIIV